MWRLENILQESILPFHHVGPGDWTQVVRLGSKCLYLPSHLPSPSFLKSYSFLSVYVYVCVSVVHTCVCVQVHGPVRTQRAEEELGIVIHPSLSYSLKTGLLTKSAARLVTNKPQQFCLHHPSTEVIGSQAVVPYFLCECECCHPNPGPHACISDTLFFFFFSFCLFVCFVFRHSFLLTEPLNPIPWIPVFLSLLLLLLLLYVCTCIWVCVYIWVCTYMWTPEEGIEFPELEFQTVVSLPLCVLETKTQVLWKRNKCF